MRIGAKIMLSAELESALDGLARLSDSCWMLSLRQRDEARREHPAGSGLNGGYGGSGLVMAMFGRPVASPEADMTLPVRWESVEPGDGFAVLLDGDITVAPADELAHSSLTLAGFCRIPAGVVTPGGSDLARIQLTEAARTFITDVASAVSPAADLTRDQELMGQAWSWVNGLPRA